MHRIIVGFSRIGTSEQQHRQKSKAARRAFVAASSSVGVHTAGENLGSDSLWFPEIVVFIMVIAW